MTIKLEASAFANNEPIPKRHTGDGEDVSPALRWTGIPAEARELALICDDPDAPTPQPWVHWLLYKLPPQTDGLRENVAKTDRPPCRWWKTNDGRRRPSSGPSCRRRPSPAIEPASPGG